MEARRNCQITLTFMRCIHIILFFYILCLCCCYSQKNHKETKARRVDSLKDEISEVPWVCWDWSAIKTPCKNSALYARRGHHSGVIPSSTPGEWWDLERGGGFLVGRVQVVHLNPILLFGCIVLTSSKTKQLLLKNILIYY